MIYQAKSSVLTTHSEAMLAVPSAFYGGRSRATLGGRSTNAEVCCQPKRGWVAQTMQGERGLIGVQSIVRV